MSARSTPRRGRRSAPALAPEAAGVPFGEWLGNVAAGAPPVGAVLASAVARWQDESNVVAGGAANPLQAARLAISVCEALGIDLRQGFTPLVEEVAALVEAEVLRQRGHSMERCERAFRASQLRSLHLRTARQLVALVRGDPGWENVGLD